MDINEYLTGSYVLEYVDIYDNAGNYIDYRNTNSNLLPENCRGLSFTINNDDPDLDPPILNDISFSKTSLTGIDDTVDVTFDAVDNKSGIEYISLGLSTINRSHYLGAYFSGELNGVFKKEEWDTWYDGIYYIDNIDITDVAGNRLHYTRDPYGDELALPEEYRNIKFTVSGCSPSGTWKKTDGKSWYEYSDGSYPQHGPEVIDGKTYLFDHDGYLVTGWFETGRTYYYADENGVVQTSKWVGEYYLKDTGVMATSEWVDNGQYYVDRNGKWVKDAKKGEAQEIGYKSDTHYQLVAGNSQTIDYQLLPTDAPQDGKMITWTTENSSVATVDADGKVTAVAPGSTRVSGTLPNGSHMEWSIIVIARLEKLEFKEGAEYRLSDEKISSPYAYVRIENYLNYYPQEAAGTEYTVTSSNRSVLTEDTDSRTLRIVGVGTTTVTVTSKDDPSISASHEFEVYPSVKPESISIDEFPTEMYLNYQYRPMTVSYGPEDAKRNTYWTSSDTSIVDPRNVPYDQKLYIYPSKTGTVTITATSEADSSLSDSITINVKEGEPKKGTYTTDFEFAEYDPEKHSVKEAITNPEAGKLEVGKSYVVFIRCESDECVPDYRLYIDAINKFNTANSFINIIPFNASWGYAMIDPDLIVTMHPMAFTVTSAGSATFSFGGRTIKLYVEGTGHWESNATGWWYVRADGSYPKNTFETIDGKTYYFNGSGYMVTGWQKINGEHYFFQTSGAMKTNAWEGNYYLLEDGRMAKNQWVDNEKYYVGADGKWIPNYGTAHWESNSTGWWYVREDGTYPANTFEEIDGKTYYFNASGYMVTGWQTVNGEYYFFETSGAMKTNAWEGNYYLLADGRMARDQWVDNNKYYVDKTGKWHQAHWESNSTGWWYVNEDTTYPV